MGPENENEVERSLKAAVAVDLRWWLSWSEHRLDACRLTIHLLPPLRSRTVQLWWTEPHWPETDVSRMRNVYREKSNYFYSELEQVASQQCELRACVPSADPITESHLDKLTSSKMRIPRNAMHCADMQTQADALDT